MALKRVAVVGGGIIGMSSAVAIAEYLPSTQVTVISEEWTPNTTGDGSAGFWSPAAVGDTTPEIFRFWCQKTFQFLESIFKSSEAGEYGVGLLSAYCLFSSQPEEPIYKDVYLQWRDLTPRELAIFPGGFRNGIFMTTFYAECRKLLPALMKRFENNGGKMITKKVERLTELAGDFDVVINCTGIQAAHLVPDPKVLPIRGQVIRVRAPWIKSAVMVDDGTYILPNSEEIICGGTYQRGDWNRQVDPNDRERIWEKCTQILPSLQGAEVLREWVGLRPGREGGPRLEKETLNTDNGNLLVIHNYGHGGSGVTLSWGCALHVVYLLQQALGITSENINPKL